MKRVIFVCNKCQSETDNLERDQWLEIKSKDDSLSIANFLPGRKLISMHNSSATHFCSPECFVDQFLKIRPKSEPTDRLTPEDGDFLQIPFSDPLAPIVHEILRQLAKAEEKHPNWPEDIFKQLAIVHEEAGEASKAVLQYVDEGGDFEEIRKELMQTAAMCIRMLKNLKP